MKLLFRDEVMHKLDWDALMPLLKAHSLEIEKKELDLNMDLYQALIDSGCYVGVTAWSKDKLVGYSGYFVSKSLHHASETVAQSDVFYLKPDYRVGWNSLRLLRFCESVLVGKGVDYIMSAAKVGSVASDFLDAIGYRVVEATYRKELTS